MTAEGTRTPVMDAAQERCVKALDIFMTMPKAKRWRQITELTGAIVREIIAEAKQLEIERDALRIVLRRYMGAYPAFRMKPVGAPGSPARIEQENLMALEEAARRALSTGSE